MNEELVSLTNGGGESDDDDDDDDDDEDDESPAISVTFRQDEECTRNARL